MFLNFSRLHFDPGKVFILASVSENIGNESLVKLCWFCCTKYGMFALL